MSIFAMKTPPDNTIKRIYDLEQQMSEVQKRLDEHDNALGALSQLDGIADINSLLTNLSNRVKACEDKELVHDDKI